MSVFKGDVEERKARTRLPAEAKITQNRLTKIPDRIVEINQFPASAREGTLRLTKENIDPIFKEFLSENKDLLKVEPENLKLSRAKKVKSQWYAKYHQYYKGIPVHNATVTIESTEDGKIKSYASNYQPDIDAPTKPAITVEKAVETAKATYARITNQTLKEKEASLIIYPQETEDKINYHLAWKFLLAGDQPDPEIEKYFVVDAQTGKIIKEYTARFPGATLTGNVKGEVYPTNPTDAVSALPNRNQYVEISGAGTAITNIAGNYSKSLPWYWFLIFNKQAVFKLDGPYAKVQNSTGANYIDTRNANSNPCNHTWTATDRDHINLFYHMNLYHDWLKDQLGYSWINHWDGTQKFNARVNYTFQNAYAGSPMQFGTDPYARSSDVICHECTHNVLVELYDDYIGWPDANTEAYAMDEGFADYFASSYTNESRHGEGYTNNPRDLNNNNKYAGRAAYNSEGHSGGTIIAGAAWDLRQKLINSQGQAAGQKTADNLLFEAHQILSTSPRNYYFSDPHQSNFLTALYKAADDNNNLQDGFPYFSYIQQAFHKHDLLQAILYSQDSYDFSTNQIGTLTGGDLYYYDGKFWANNYNQKGVIDIGDLGNVDIATVNIPQTGYTRFGVTATKDHTYVSLAQEGETAGYIAFRVTAISADKSQVTVRYLYRKKYFISKDLFDAADIMKFLDANSVQKTYVKIENGKLYTNRDDDRQIGIIDLGDTKYKPLEETKLPTRGHKKDGVPIIENHTYLATYKSDRKTTNVIFTVDQIDEKGITIQIL